MALTLAVFLYLLKKYVFSTKNSVAQIDQIDRLVHLMAQSHLFPFPLNNGVSNVCL